MTQTIDARTAAAVSPQARVDAWLADFEAALASRDVERAVAKFAVDSFWRDLISFTWNIKTMEGREGIADMLTERAAATDPSGFRTRETPTDDGGVVSAWIEFETPWGGASAISASRTTRHGRC
jgi:putative flavoprotein involved in K+ transport